MIKYCLLFLVCTMSWKGQTQIAVSTDKMRVLYLGISNPLTIVTSDIPPECLLIKTSVGKLTHKADYRYEWKHCGSENEVIITVGDSLNPFFSDTFTFRLRNVGEPRFWISLPNGAEHKNGGIAGSLENLNFDIRVTLDSFLATWYPKNGDPVVKTNKGNRFNGEVTHFFNRSLPGDKFLFSEFTHHWLCGKRTVSDQVIYIQLDVSGKFIHIKPPPVYTPPPEH